MIDRCPRFDAAVRRRARRHQHDAIERSARIARGARGFEVAEMDGIERAAENADAVGDVMLRLSRRASARRDHLALAVFGLARGEVSPDRLPEERPSLHQSPPRSAGREDRAIGRTLRARATAGRIADRVHLRRGDDLRLGSKLAAEQRELRSGSSRNLRSDRVPMPPDTSTRCTSTFVRSRCLRKRSPSPLPSCAPSISPGTSATTKLRLPAKRHDAEIRRERGEGIVGDLRPRGRNARDQRRLAGVGKSHQTDIGEQFQTAAAAVWSHRECRLRSVAGRGWWS